MKVKYVGGMDFFDGLTTGDVYTVIEENESQYIVENDLWSTSTIQKAKFETVSWFEKCASVKNTLVEGRDIYFKTKAVSLQS